MMEEEEGGDYLSDWVDLPQRMEIRVCRSQNHPGSLQHCKAECGIQAC